MRESFLLLLIPIKVEGTNLRIGASCQDAIKMDDRRRKQSATVPEGRLLSVRWSLHWLVGALGLRLDSPGRSVEV
jgi:hypothetical protein